MKYCTHCGKEVLDDAIICPACGCSVQYGEAPKRQQQQQARPQPTQSSLPNYNDSCSALSIVGFVLCFVWSLVGLIISIVAHNEAKRTGSEKSRSLSKAGIIVSSVFLGITALAVLIWLIIFIAAMISMGGAGYMAI